MGSTDWKGKKVVQARSLVLLKSCKCVIISFPLFLKTPAIYSIHLGTAINLETKSAVQNPSRHFHIFDNRTNGSSAIVLMFSSKLLSGRNPLTDAAHPQPLIDPCWLLCVF